MAGTFYMTARSLLVRAQMMVRAMSSCSSCSAWCRTGRGEYVRTCLMRSFPPAGSAPRTETCTRPHARTSDFIAISVGLLGGLVHCRRMPSCRTGWRRHGAAQTVVQRCRFGSATIHGLWRKWGQLDYVVCESFITHPDRLLHRMISH